MKKDNLLPFSLLFGESELGSIREKARSPWGARLMKQLRENCKEEVTKPVHMKDREWTGKASIIMDLAFLGLIDESSLYLGAAKERVMAMIEVDPWVHASMLKTGEIVRAVALALDWGWQSYSKKEATAVIDAMIASAIENGDPRARVNTASSNGYIQSLADFLSYHSADNEVHFPDIYNPWHSAIQSTNNWEVVVGVGLMLGCLVVDKAVNEIGLPIGKNRDLGFEVNKQKIDDWYDIAKQRYMNFSSRTYSNMGQYNEGPGYYSYGTINGLIGLEAARRAKGEDLYSFGLKKSPLWQRQLYPWRIKDGAMNFNDSYLPGHPAPEVIARLAAVNQSPWMQKFFFELPSSSSRHPLLVLIWADRKLKAAKHSYPKSNPKYIDFGETGDIVYRTGRNPGKDIHWVFQCGKWNAAHTHRGRNALVLSAFGERLLVDAGTSKYGSKVCEKYQRATEGHNTVLVGGEEQVGTNEAPTHGRILRSFSNQAGGAVVVGDAKQCYPHASAALRAVYYDPAGFIVVYDYLKSTLKQKHSLLWHTDNRDSMASIIKKGNKVVLKRPKASLSIVSLPAPNSIIDKKGYIDRHSKGSALYVEMKYKKGELLTLLFPMKPSEEVAVQYKKKGIARRASFQFKGKNYSVQLLPKGHGFKVNTLKLDFSKELTL